MKKKLVFVNTVTYSNATVAVGIDHLMGLGGVLALLLQLAELCGAEPPLWWWVALGTLLAHVRQWRHVMTLPLLGSLLVAAMSGGMSMLVSALVINKLIAQQYRDAGWKILNEDGELGEYSSRFLAMEHLGFNESDLLLVRAEACGPQVVDWPDDDGEPDPYELALAQVPELRNAA
ncbi:MAG: hypothetical protein RJA44_855 [Pseudomonadota bacterium]